MSDDPDSILFAVIDRSDDLHVGNVGLAIDRRHESATIGLILGEAERWGRGHASEAISLISRYAFEELGLGKLTAGCYAENEGSRRAFEKAGFVVEGRRRSQRIAHDGRRTDELQLGLVAPGG
jgi:RimJ/RimL family protein N-acetyltransferase